MKTLLAFLVLLVTLQLEARTVEYPEAAFEIPDDLIQENYSDPANLTMRRFMKIDLQHHHVFFVVSSLQEETGGRISLATLKVQELLPTDDLKRSYLSYYKTLGPVWALGPIESISVSAQKQRILIVASAELMDARFKSTEIILPLNDGAFFAIDVLCEEDQYDSLRSTVEKIVQSCHVTSSLRLAE